jgi:chromosome segregation ATPase
MSDDKLNYQSSEGSRMGTYLITGALAVAIGCNLFTFWRLNQFKNEMAEWRASVTSDFADLRQSSTVTTAQSHQRLDALRQEVETARMQASRGAGQAKVEAQRHADQLAAQLAAEQQKQAEQQQQMASQLGTVGTEVGEVREAASTANTKIGEVSQEVAATKTELQNTITEMKRVNGDLGVMSGLIATNGKELDALKALGDRNYFEFDLRKTDKPQRVGDIAVRLRKADPKRNKYTVEVLADDKLVEKKDKNSNEPVQFYAAKARQPYELVVNEVRKDEVVGYLSTPKVQMARR